MTSESSNSAEPIVAPHSLPALLIGAVLSMVISGALVIATAKAGISPGVSPLVVLIGWVVFGSIMRGRLKSFLAILQVTGSGGAAVSAGLIFTDPIIQISASLMGRDVLNRRFDPDASTYWQHHKQADDSKRYFQQF